MTHDRPVTICDDPGVSSQPAPRPVSVRRYVAVGDSTTEGVGDPLPDGRLRGWADRFAEGLAARQGSVSYANLAIRGRRTRQILDEQAAAAVSLQPDLITAVVGVNDLLATDFDAGAFESDVEELFGMLRRDDATVLSSTLPDLSGLVPLPSRVLALLRQRHATLNAALGTVAVKHSVRLLPLDDLPGASDRRVWRPDRLHPNPLGHALLATAMLQLLDGEPITVSAESQPGYGTVPYARAGLVSAAAWGVRYLAPRTVRRLRGRSSGDGRAPKRATLDKLTAEAAT